MLSHNKHSSHISYKIIIRLAHTVATNNVNADNMKASLLEAHSSCATSHLYERAEHGHS